IGVHLGDVIEKPDGTVYGTGVNIAARLQAKAWPGGLCMSETLYDSVKHQVALNAQFAGRQRLKNIEEPVAIWQVLPEGAAAGRPVSEALVRHFADRHILLILDNCEHLVQGCAELAKQLLLAGPHAKVLASSREPLRIGGETTYPVPALPESEAVRLFVDRAGKAKPGFRVNGEAAAVASVCRRLDGLPLAIELAAARVRTLSVEAIASRLEDR